MPARSYLYVPGDRPDRLAKARLRAGDAVIADLEDAVPEPRKEAARGAVITWLTEAAAPAVPELWVRINSGARGEADLEALLSSSAGALAGVVVPKADGGSLRRAAAIAAGVPAERRPRLCALIESASGLTTLAEVAATPGVSHLAMGEADLAADLGLDPSEDGRELLPLRVMVVVASAAAGLAAPTAPVDIAVRDLDGLRASTDALRRQGFGARSAVHPDQVPVIEAVFTPEAEAVARARALLARHDGGGAAVDGTGRLVDAAVLRAAHRIVATADRLGL